MPKRLVRWKHIRNCEVTPIIGLVDEQKKSYCCEGTSRTETCVAPRHAWHVDESPRGAPATVICSL